MESFKWTCPFCDNSSIVTNENYYTGFAVIDDHEKYESKAGQIHFIACPNPECDNFTLYADLCETRQNTANAPKRPGKILKTWNL